MGATTSCRNVSSKLRFHVHESLHHDTLLLLWEYGCGHDMAQLWLLRSGKANQFFHGSRVEPAPALTKAPGCFWWKSGMRLMSEGWGVKNVLLTGQYRIMFASSWRVVNTQRIEDRGRESLCPKCRSDMCFYKVSEEMWDRIIIIVILQKSLIK